MTMEEKLDEILTEMLLNKMSIGHKDVYRKRILSLILNQITKEVEGMKKDEILTAQGSFSQDDYMDHGYNQALSDVLKLLQDKGEK